MMGPRAEAAANAWKEGSSRQRGGFLMRLQQHAELLFCASRPDFTPIDLDAHELDVWLPWSSRHSECIFSSGSLLSKC